VFGADAATAMAPIDAMGWPGSFFQNLADAVESIFPADGIGRAPVPTAPVFPGREIVDRVDVAVGIANGIEAAVRGLEVLDEDMRDGVLCVVQRHVDDLRDISKAAAKLAGLNQGRAAPASAANPDAG
jgi:hypothetical protein